MALLSAGAFAQTSNLWRPQPNPTPPPCPQIRQFYNISGSFQQIDCNGVITTISAGANLQDPGANGMLARIAVNTTAARTITGTAGRITVADGNGLAGNPTIDIGANVATSSNNLSFFAATTSAQLAGAISDETGSGSLVFNSSPTIVTPTIASFANAAHNHEGAAGGGQFNASNVFSAGSVPLARGGTGSSLADPNAHRLLGWDDTNGDVRFFIIGSGLNYDANTDTLSVTVGGLNDPGANGIVARTALNTTVARTLQQPAAGLTITNPGGVAGDPTFTLANDLGALEGLSSAGVAVRATTDTWALRTLTGTANRIVVANGNGASDNPTFDIGSDVVTLTGTQTLTNKTVRGYPRSIEVSTTTVGNVGTGLDNLHSFSLLAGSLANNGDYLRIRYGGAFATNDNDKRIRISFDGQTAHDPGLFDQDSGTWVYDIVYTRVSATTVRASALILWNFINRDGAGTVAGNGLFSAPAVLLTVADLNVNPVTLLVQAEGTSNDDITQNLSIVELVQR